MVKITTLELLLDESKKKTVQESFTQFLYFTN